MKFIPNASLKTDILHKMNCTSIDKLFSDIPKEILIKKLQFENGRSQQDTEQKLQRIAAKNSTGYPFTSFLGGGIKQHYIPAVVTSILRRAEFFTAYTPYQSEASQGFLQAMFEYQSMIADLMQMDVANCSLYDGATALGEAALMCTRIKRKQEFLVPTNISWEKQSILKNYTKGANITLTEIPYNQETGMIDADAYFEKMHDSVSGLYIENPNYFGIFEEQIKKIVTTAHDHGVLVVMGIHPLALGIMKSPGELGADIAIGEGRCLGNAIDFGGSSLGLFACKQQFLRQIPGRIIGATTDKKGKQAYCMTMQTREQHIRRGKATSNICTNEGLCALAATVYLSWLGGNGLQKLSETNFQRGQDLTRIITEIDGFSQRFTGTHFNECVIQTSHDVQMLNKQLLSQQIQGGLVLNPFYPDLRQSLLFGATELHSVEDIQRLASVLKEAVHV